MILILDGKVGESEAKDLLDSAIGTFYQRTSWKPAGLFIPIGPDSTKKGIIEGVRCHDLVTSFLVKHSHDDNFDEEYFHGPEQVKYFKVLDLAEKAQEAE